MSTSTRISVLPYSSIVGQLDLKLALELAYINPAVTGVLLSGQRGTAKSTAVRAFAHMIYDGASPVTLPINATEDRVIGGWNVKGLMSSKAIWQDGLLKEADGKLLYVDEVNLLDDHIVNLILDVASTGILVIQRESEGSQEPVTFTLVGTMNPEEGGLRPQLMDRFGLMVEVEGDADRLAILKKVLDFDAVQARTSDDALATDRQSDVAKGKALAQARKRLAKVKAEDSALERCVELARRFEVEGHRAERVMAHAARARASLENRDAATVADVNRVARLALQHRRPRVAGSERMPWGPADDKKINS